MKSIVFALALSAAAGAEIKPGFKSTGDFKADMIALGVLPAEGTVTHGAAPTEDMIKSMKAPHAKLTNSPAKKQGLVSKMVSKLRGDRDLTSIDDVLSAFTDGDDCTSEADCGSLSSDTNAEVCTYIQKDVCYVADPDPVDLTYTLLGTTYGFTLSSCSTCAYATLTDTDDVNVAALVAMNTLPNLCYTCPSGYTNMVMLPGLCLGSCINDAGVDTFTLLMTAVGVAVAPAETAYASTIPTSQCFSFGTTYPLDCYPSDKSSDDAECFSGVDTVQLESGKFKVLSEVQVGDRILSADANGALSFSDVVFLPHAANGKLATFMQITTSGGKSLKATKMHLLQTCTGDLAYAGSLKSGDCLRTVDGDEHVAAIEKTDAVGIYSVVTQNEFVVISGVIASPFAFSHGATNAVYNVHRSLYNVAPSLLKSTAMTSANAAIGAAAVVAANMFSDSK